METEKNGNGKKASMNSETISGAEATQLQSTLGPVLQPGGAMSPDYRTFLSSSWVVGTIGLS